MLRYDSPEIPTHRWTTTFHPVIPVLHFVIPEGGLGMIVENALFRYQARLYVRPDKLPALLLPCKQKRPPTGTFAVEL